MKQKTNDNKSTREQASKWFASKTYLEQHELSDKYFESRNPSLLTIEQVEEIYDKEVLEPKRQEEWQESQVNRRYSKPNAKKFKQFDESLFKSYIDKMPESESLNMIKIINGRIYYLGIYGNLFKDITDEYLKYQLSKQKH